MAFAAMMLACAENVEANDGVCFTSGNFLVPTVGTDISAAKEILTITIGTDSFARVDVYYEFANSGSPKTVTMAFEASAQCGDTEPLNRRGVHPHVEDFTVNMNGERLKCGNSVVAINGGAFPHSGFKPLNMAGRKGAGEAPDTIMPVGDNTIYNPNLGSVVGYACAYSFEAPFKHGLNVVHHTYKYRMSYNNYGKFTIPYWLTPATRWANGKVGDFTLRITADDSMVGFCLVDTLFKGAPFTSVKGTPIYHMKSETYNNFLYACMTEGDTIVWRCRDFRPTADISIDSPWWETLPQSATSAKVVIDSNGNEARYIADCGDSCFISVQDFVFVKKAGRRIVEYDARKGKGCIYIAGDGARRVNVRRAPGKSSPIVCSISDSGEGIPEVYPCLGLVSGDDDHDWYKTKVNGKIGYIRQDLMQWDAINTF